MTLSTLIRKGGLVEIATATLATSATVRAVPHQDESEIAQVYCDSNGSTHAEDFELAEREQKTEIDAQEAIEEHLGERAAIMEFDGGLPRDQAETEARRALQVFKYRITDSPDSWLVLIAPGCDLDDARESLRRRFGSRLVDVQTYQPRNAV
jgi:hypothetical protein